MNERTLDSGGFVLWLMGPTSSGKTTVAEALVEAWRSNGTHVLHWDGDEIRDFFGASLGFASEDRLRVVHTLAHLSAKSAKAGVATIVSALTAHADARAFIKSAIDPLVICYLQCPVEICADRDPKQLYAKAKAGEISTLIGFNTPYVAPIDPEIIVETNQADIAQSVEQITAYLRANGYRI